MVIPLFLFAVSSIWVLLKIGDQQSPIEFSILSSFIILFTLYRHVFFGPLEQVKTPRKILLGISALFFPFFANFLFLFFYTDVGNENFGPHGYLSLVLYFLLSILAALFALLYRLVEKKIFQKKIIRFYPKRAFILGVSWVLIFGLGCSLLPDGELTRLLRAREAGKLTTERVDWNFSLAQEGELYRLYQEVDGLTKATGLEIPLFPEDIAGPYLFISPSKRYVLYNSWKETTQKGERVNQEVLMLSTIDGEDRLSFVNSMQKYDYSFHWSSDELAIDVCSWESERGEKELFFGQFKIEVSPSLDFMYYRMPKEKAIQCPIESDVPLTVNTAP